MIRDDLFRSKPSASSRPTRIVGVNDILTFQTQGYHWQQSMLYNAARPTSKSKNSNWWSDRTKWPTRCRPTSELYSELGTCYWVYRPMYTCLWKGWCWCGSDRSWWQLDFRISSRLAARLIPPRWQAGDVNVCTALFRCHPFILTWWK